jgi:hypothetical protein
MRLPDGTAEAPAVLYWATGGPYVHEYNQRTAGGWGCDPCAACRQSPAPGSVIYMNCYHDLYCGACALERAGAWLAQRHPFVPPMFGDTYCSRSGCGAKRNDPQHANP